VKALAKNITKREQSKEKNEPQRIVERAENHDCKEEALREPENNAPLKKQY